MRQQPHHLLFLALVQILLQGGVQSQCSLCGSAAEDAQLVHGDRIVPFLGLRGNSDPDCQFVADRAFQLTSDQDCALVQAQASFCGCPNAPAVIEPAVCSLCATTDLVPGVPNKETPFGDTCGELDDYLRHQTSSECASPRIEEDIKAVQWMCECPNSPTPDCPLCKEEDHRTLAFPDRVVPFFNSPVSYTHLTLPTKA